MKRRDFITLLGGAAVAWPMAADAQTATPVIGFLDSRSPDALADRLRGFRLGLKLAGYAEGENVAVVYRFAENQAERLPALAVELVQLPVQAEAPMWRLRPRRQRRRSLSCSSMAKTRSGVDL